MPLRWTYAVLILAFLFVLMPFLFWQQTWFGSPLTDEELAKSFADVEHPRKIQHALVEVEKRISQGDASAARWYPDVIAQAESKVHELRMTAAWVMGQDNKIPEFHDALLRLLRDSHPMVRRNAALALVRFGDASGHDEVIGLLLPYAMKSPAAGALDQRLQVGDTVNPGTLVGRVTAGDQETEIRADVPGTLEQWLVGEGAAVQAGQGIARLGPDQSSVWEALRALVLIGRAEDLPIVERYTSRFGDAPESIQQQARATAQAIRKRASE
ncbi:MAG: HEAT repeat domain-containing protein [Candidatus Acidiferrales bacterium]